ncbi:uncharacterized protein LOC141649772 [Silene latifolia]|uniref:uncharacterized protein LOC141649772 n=1 Tax=Silene latifolia TaxID=37657 RepID=UPI003D7795F0
MDNIAARVRGESSSCYFCTSSSESSLHLFRDCNVAKWVWSSLNLDGAEEGDMVEGAEEVREWVEGIWQAGDARDMEKYMVGCWAIWEHRNKVAFDGVAIEPERIVGRVKDIASELESGGEGRQGCRRDRRGRTEERGNDGWKPATNGFVKINVDAGIKEGEGVSSGVVCRDDRGGVLWGMTIARNEEWDPRFAEAAAVYDGLLEAQLRGHRDVVIESDCIQVIEALQAQRNGRSLFLLLIEDILLLSNSFNSVIWSYTGRVNNSVAHALAHIFPRVVGKTIWSTVLPPVADSAAAYDLSLI